MAPRRHIAVFGLGLIGASIAMDLRDQGAFVAGFDARAEHAAQAVDRGAIDEALTAPSGVFDVIVLAAPPTANIALLASDARAALWLDTGSVKTEIVRQAQERGLPFVGGHPLAGTEGGGPQAAARGLFRGRGFALCPGGGPKDAAEEIARALGARPIWLDAATHDLEVARSSHIVYAWSCALAALLEDTPPELVGPAAREMLRVATSPTGLWQEILAMNGPAVGETLEVALRALRAAASGDAATLDAARLTARRLREDDLGNGG